MAYKSESSLHKSFQNYQNECQSISPVKPEIKSHPLQVLFTSTFKLIPKNKFLAGDYTYLQ